MGIRAGRRGTARHGSPNERTNETKQAWRPLEATLQKRTILLLARPTAKPVRRFSSFYVSAWKRRGQTVGSRE